jgi:hypothetical protein
MLGAFAALNVRNLDGSKGSLAAEVVGGLSMITLLLLCERFAWLKKEYALGLAMLMGMAVAMTV